MNVECPSITEIAEYLTAGLTDSALEQHLAGCRRCKALLKHLQVTEIADAAQVAPTSESREANIPDRGAPAEWSWAEVAVLRAPAAPRERLLCVVLDVSRIETDATLELAPVSEEVVNASDLDVILESADGPIGYPVMVELWNHGTVMASQVAERFGLLADSAQIEIGERYAALYAEADDGVRDDGMVVGERTRSEGEDRAWSGVPIASSVDPRAVFQEAEAERARAFWVPAGNALSGETPVAASGWDRVMTLAAGDWCTEQFPYEEIIAELAATDVSSSEIESSLILRLSALIASGHARIEPMHLPPVSPSTWIEAHDLALAAGLDQAQTKWIKEAAAWVAVAVVRSRADDVQPEIG